METDGKIACAPPDTPTLGSKIGLTLLSDFSDAPATVPQAEVVQFLNCDSYAGSGNTSPFKEYFLDNSDNKLIYSNVVTAYVRMSQPKSFYDNVSVAADLQGRQLILDALAVLKAHPNFNSEILPLFHSLTVDSGNMVAVCNVYFAGGNSGVWSQGRWPHSWILSSPVELSPGG